MIETSTLWNQLRDENDRNINIMETMRDENDRNINIIESMR